MPHPSRPCREETLRVEFSGSKRLFGADPEPGIVAVEWNGKNATHGEDAVRIFLRGEGGATLIREERLHPFLWSAAPEEGSLCLQGDLALRHLVEFKNWEELEKFRRHRPDHFAINDPVQQYLTASGKTLFKGMNWSALRRFQLDIETSCSEGFDFSNPERDPLLGIAVSDHTGWEEFLVVPPDVGPEGERAALEELSRLIAERDPDIFEGHNLLKFDLPYLVTRARKLKCRLAWGRDGSTPRSRASRLQIAEKTIQFSKFSVHGRHILDTWILAQLYDVGTRELEGFGLKSVAAHFGVAEKDRLILSAQEIREAAASDPERLRCYALQDVRETRAIADLLGGSYFIQAQLFPLSFQDVVLRGNATRINALFLREYLRCRHSIPQFPEPEPFEGGYTDIFLTGVLKDVWHCDVASLYPSVILKFGLTPALDVLGIFGGLLAELRTFRLEAKALARSAPDPGQKHYFHALQGVFKILINSFYGYLGFAQGHFADFQAAAAVTARGRELLRSMVEWLNGQGARVIEIDTDGVYFQPPLGTSPEKMERAMRATLPEGIDVEFDHRYQAMFSYKAKNYALLELDGRLNLKGAALKSRGMERYLRVYLTDLIRLLLEEKTKEAAALRDAFVEKITQRQWPLEMLMKTDTLQDSPASYQKKIGTASRNRSAVFELALQSNRNYQAGDQISYYITGTKKSVTVYQAAKLASTWNPALRDENIAYYVGKLDDLAKKFAPFLEIPCRQGELELM